MNQEGREAALLDHSEIDAYAEAYRRGEGSDPLSWLRERNPGNVAGVAELRTLGLLIRHRDALTLTPPPAVSPNDPTSLVGPEMSDASRPPARSPLVSAAFRNWLREHHQLELLGPLGGDRGGMGDVYLAWQRVMKCEMVVKIPRDHHRRERFHREIQLQAKLGGEHIAIARSSPLYGDMPLLVVDYIPGPSLRQYLNTAGRVPWPEAGEIIRQAALGLGHAHRRGVIHRDVKPGNLVRSGRDGRLYVIDWGLACDLNTPRAADTHLTAGPLGTPRYCPPEQAADASSATPASDLYGLGCTWYELIAGRTPFEGKNARQLWRAHAEEPVPPLDPALGVPEEVEHLIRKLLDKDPSRRFETADEFVEALDRTQVPVVPPGWPWKLPAAVAALVLALTLAAWAPWSAGSRPAASPVVRDLVVEISNPSGKPGRTGTIGSTIYQATEGDEATIRGDLASATYAYLIAFLPNGQMKLCSPADPSTRPSPDDPPAYPPAGHLNPVFGLQDGPGLQAFAIVGSRSPLPAFQDWVARAGAPPWHVVGEFDPGLVWTSDGRSIKALQAGKLPDDRSTGYRSRGARGVVADLTDWLKAAPGVEVVYVKAFAVVAPKP